MKIQMLRITLDQQKIVKMEMMKMKRKISIIKNCLKDQNY